MIDTLVFAIGEIVRDQAVADVLGECAEDVARFVQPPGAYGQPFEADHRVPAPIREPMIAGDDGTDFVAARLLGRAFGSAGRGEQKLVRRQHQFRG